MIAAAIDSTVETPRPRRVDAAILNWVTNVGYTGITMVASMVSTPLLLKYLGAERLGANRVMTEWFGYLLLAEFGLGPTLSVLFFRARSGGDPREVAATLRFALRLYLRLSAVMFPFGLLLAWILPYLVGVQPAIQTELRWAGVIAALGFLLYPLGVFRTLLETQQRTYVAVAALVVQSLTAMGVSVLLAWMGWGLMAQSAALLFGMVVYNLIITNGVRGDISAAKNAAPREIHYADLWKLAWPFAVTDLATRLNLMTDNIVVGFVLGPTQVAAFFLTQRLPMLIGGQVVGVANSAWAGLAELKSEGDDLAYESRVVELARIMIGVGIPITGVVAAYNMRFVDLWVGSAQYGGDLVSLLTAAAAVISSFLQLFARAVDIHGDARLRVKMSIWGACLNLALSIALAHTRLGMAGVILGTVIASLATDAWFAPYLVCKRYGVRWQRLLGGCVRGALWGTLWAAVVWWFARSHAPLGANEPSRLVQWLSLIAELGVVGLLTLLYCWAFILSPAERTLWLARFGKLSHRFRAPPT